ncbi:MAG: HD domain-containing protein [Treponema sp.]|nr:HD domain-containing protein [Treponema sp.]
MTREISNFLSTGLDIYNCIICLFMILFYAKDINKHPCCKYFFAICLSVFIFNVADMANWISEGTDQSWKIPYLHVMTFVYYLAIPCTLLFFIKYVNYFIYPASIKPIYIKITYGLCLIYTIGLIATLFTDFYYVITPDNFYHRGRFVYISYGFNLIFHLLSMVIILGNKKSFTKANIWIFLSFPLFPLIAFLLQIKLYGFGLVNTGMTFSILLVFMNAHNTLENDFLEKDDLVRQQEKNLILHQEHTINGLSNLVEERDAETGQHAQRTTIFVERIARQTQKDGFYKDILSDEYIRHMVKSAPMHDIGKIIISDTILKKPGPERLTPEEYEQIKRHAPEGGRIIRELFNFSDDEDYVSIAEAMAKSHHEHWDGSGYPEKLKEEEIPLCARIMAIADVFDALVFIRCYKAPWTPTQAFDYIREAAGTHFDPILVEEFFKVKNEILRLVPPPSDNN